MDLANEKLKMCMDEIKSWMDRNFLKLNTDKTTIQVFMPGSLKKNPKLAFSFNDGETVIKASGMAKILGVTLDKDMNFSEFATKKVQVCNMHLRNLRNIKESLSQKVKALLVSQLILSTLDYCNALLICVPKYIIKRLQVTMNNSIRFIFGLKRRDHISEYLFKLHILPMEYRVRFKVSLIAHKIVNGFAPEYLSEIFKTYTPSTTINLRANCGRDSLMLDSCFGHPPLFENLVSEWNSLPYFIRATIPTVDFKKHLKTFYFKKAFPQFIDAVVC